MDFDKWQADLVTAIADVLHEFRSFAEDEMAIFAVDCHPWNGIIVLAFLTSQEKRNDPLLMDASEMAAWKYYDFAAEFTSWQCSRQIGAQMRKLYDDAREGHEHVVRQSLRACADVVASEPVQTALAKYRLAPSFKIMITHPDTGEEYFRYC
jgi:hypothetical protein